MLKIKVKYKTREERGLFPFKVTMAGSCTIFFVTPAGDGPAVLPSCGNSKEARGKRNIKLTFAESREPAREAVQESGRMHWW